MITIVEGPKANKRERNEFTSFNGGTVYQADKRDYEYWNPNGIWGYRIACPICGDNTWHKYNERLRKYDGVREVLKSEEETSNN